MDNARRPGGRRHNESEGQTMQDTQCNHMLSHAIAWDVTFIPAIMCNFATSLMQLHAMRRQRTSSSPNNDVSMTMFVAAHHWTNNGHDHASPAYNPGNDSKTEDDRGGNKLWYEIGDESNSMRQLRGGGRQKQEDQQKQEAVSPPSRVLCCSLSCVLFTAIN